MIYTYTVNVGDGVTKDFPFSFAGQDTGYLSTSNIVVTVAGVEVSGYTIQPSSPNIVRFMSAPAIGAEVLIRRVMPKQVPYTDFSRGNPFSQDALNNTNLQMLYLLQEIYDGYLPSGFYFRVDIDMRGNKLINLGDGVNDGDSVNMKQFKVEVNRNNNQDSRIVALEDNLVAGTVANFFAQLYVATGGETTVNTTNGLFCSALYINGLYQHKIAGAYSQNGAVITLAEPLKAGWEVYMILGTDLPSDSIYATIESVTALESVVAGINSQYAKKGANNDITSLSGLTTPLSIGQGGNGNSAGRSASSTKLDVPRGVRVNLASTSAENFDGTSDINPGVQGVLPVANGGTGNVSGKAVALATARSFQVNLASTSAVNFDGSGNASPGVAGTLPVTNGGTGQTDVSFVRAETTTSTSLAASTFIKQMPLEVADTKSAYDPATGNWVAPAAGYYHVIGSVRFGAATTKTCTRIIKLDSATAPSAGAVVGQTTLATSGDNDVYLQVSAILSLAAGASLALYAYHTDTATMFALHSSLQVIRVR